jgi:hypothetical protein
VGHAAHHQREQLRLGHARDVRLDDQRRLGLAHEDVGRHRERLGAAGPHQVHHRARHQRDHPLQDAVVVEDGEERRDEDDRRQRREGEHEPVRQHLAEDFLLGEIAEHERRAFPREREEPLHDRRDGVEELIARPDAEDLELQDEDGQQQLQANPPRHGPDVHGPQVRRARGDDQDEADDAAEGLRPRVDVALQEVREDGEREGGPGTREAERTVVGHDV